MSKTITLKKAIYLAVFISFDIVGLILSCSSEQDRTDSPNIVLINIDDMGWNDVSFMGSKYYDTPNIDSSSGTGIGFYSRLVPLLQIVLPVGLQFTQENGVLDIKFIRLILIVVKHRIES